MNKEPDTSNVVNMFGCDQFTDEKTNKLISTICQQIAKDDISCKDAFTVLITLSFSLLYHGTRIDKRSAVDAAKFSADLVYNRTGTGNE